MAQRRMISRSISTSQKLARVSDFAALLYTWLIPWTDDMGRMDGDKLLIKAKVVPLRAKSVRKIEDALRELEKTQLILRYKVSHSTYLQVVDFHFHQTFKNDRGRKAEYPPHPSYTERTLESTGIQKIPLSAQYKRREGNLRSTGELLKRRTGDNSRSSA